MSDPRKRSLAYAAGALCLVACYSWLAAGTRTFTMGAALATSAALVAFVAVLLLQWRLGAHSPAAMRRWPRTGSPDAEEARPARRGVLVWAVAVALVVGFEVANLFQTPRRAHPTLSYLLDAAGGHQWSKALAFALWLLFGWYLVRR